MSLIRTKETYWIFERAHEQIRPEGRLNCALGSLPAPPTLAGLERRLCGLGCRCDGLGLGCQPGLAVGDATAAGEVDHLLSAKEPFESTGAQGGVKKQTDELTAVIAMPRDGCCRSTTTTESSWCWNCLYRCWCFC